MENKTKYKLRCFVCLQVIQTSKTLLESYEGVYERILQTQKAGKGRLDGGRRTTKGCFSDPIRRLLNAASAISLKPHHADHSIWKFDRPDYAFLIWMSGITI